MVDMKREPQDGMTNSEYSYGLGVSFSDEELEKLGLDASCEVGDLLHMVAMAKVTSVSKSEHGCRIEMTLIDIETLEDENEEFERPKMNPNKFYKDED